MKATAILALLAAVLLFGCAPEPCPGVSSECDAMVRGACVLFGDLAETWPADERAKVPAQVEQGILAGAEYWGADPDKIADGWTIVLSGPVPDPEGPYNVNGLCWTDCRVIRVWAWPSCSAVFLPHELGHAVIGDGEHLDPRWAEVPKPGRC